MTQKKENRFLEESNTNKCTRFEDTKDVLFTFLSVYFPYCNFYELETRIGPLKALDNVQVSYELYLS